MSMDFFCRFCISWILHATCRYEQQQKNIQLRPLRLRCVPSAGQSGCKPWPGSFKSFLTWWFCILFYPCKKILAYAGRANCWGQAPGSSQGFIWVRRLYRWQRKESICDVRASWTEYLTLSRLPSLTTLAAINNSFNRAMRTVLVTMCRIMLFVFNVPADTLCCATIFM